MLLCDQVSIHFPLRRARLRRKMLSGSAQTGGKIITHNGAPYVAALQGITTHFQKGDCVALIGHNGSGKTTLLRTLAGIYQPFSGRVTRHGRTATMFSSTVRRHIKRHRFRPGPRETLLTLLVDIRRRLCGIATVVVRLSFP
jgi:ABC-type polysaccharide/polyol phosphate transport system ATPase subunit